MAEAPVRRPLTAAEIGAVAALVRGCPPEFAAVLEQAKQAIVTGRCHCGCATIDIQVPIESQPVSDFTGLLPAEATILRDDAPADTLIVFLRDGRLVGLEVFGVADTALRELPPADRLIVEPTEPT